MSWHFLMGAAAALVFIKVRRALKQRKYRQRNILDHNNQIRFVKRAALRTKPLMNKSEYEVYRALEKHFSGDAVRERVFVQVNLGEFIRADYDNEARRSFNSKRVDFLIIDQYGTPRIAIEYHGPGHYGNHAEERDAVKKLCFEKAGIHFIEIIGTPAMKNYDETLIPVVRDLLNAAQSRHVII